MDWWTFTQQLIFPRHFYCSWLPGLMDGVWIGTRAKSVFSCAYLTCSVQIGNSIGPRWNSRSMFWVCLEGNLTWGGTGILSFIIYARLSGQIVSVCGVRWDANYLPPSTPTTTPSTSRSSPYIDSQVGRREPVQSSIKDAVTTQKDEGLRPRRHNPTIAQNDIRSLIVIGPALNDMVSQFSPALHVKHIILVSWCKDSKEILLCSHSHGKNTKWKTSAGFWKVGGGRMLCRNRS